MIAANGYYERVKQFEECHLPNILDWLHDQFPAALTMAGHHMRLALIDYYAEHIRSHYLRTGTVNSQSCSP
jgi:hypothetical protein